MVISINVERYPVGKQDLAGDRILSKSGAGQADGIGKPAPALAPLSVRAFDRG
ncbi:hypothetical protein [Agrobacterium vitis]|uniref:Uncharacterized protein n=1 Tax=Agrobacterium vitis TaxID=373 RepID=A0AAE2RBF0_AGRVI|nr:hypothetical protein [Agrobacterium vitis]MBF2715153.1 hypothetical protein [Agrobacterium vitis]